MKGCGKHTMITILFFVKKICQMVISEISALFPAMCWSEKFSTKLVSKMRGKALMDPRCTKTENPKNKKSENL